MDANLQDGEALVKEGDLDDTLYILTKGTINVCHNYQGQNKAIYTMKVGECAGCFVFCTST